MCILELLLTAWPAFLGFCQLLGCLLGLVQTSQSAFLSYLLGLLLQLFALCGFQRISWSRSLHKAKKAPKKAGQEGYIRQRRHPRSQQKSEKAPKKLTEADTQEGRTRSLQMPSAQEVTTRRLCKAPKKFEEAQEGRTRSIQKANKAISSPRRHMLTSCPAVLGVCYILVGQVRHPRSLQKPKKAGQEGYVRHPR